MPFLAQKDGKPDKNEGWGVPPCNPIVLMGSNASTDGQSQLTESIVGGVDRGDEPLEQVWNLVLDPVIPGTVGVRGWC